MDKQSWRVQNVNIFSTKAMLKHWLEQITEPNFVL